VTKPANPKIADLSVIYTLNLLEQKSPSLRQLHANGSLPCTPTYAAIKLGADLHPGRTESLARARTAPEGAFLAVDLVVVEHPGCNIQGVDLVYASSAKRAVLAHAFVSSALVYANKEHDPIPYRLEPFLTSALATEEYPHRTPGAAFVETVTQARTDGVEFQAALVDAQFTDQITLGQLREAKVALIGRYRTDIRVTFEGETVGVRRLAERFKPGVSRYYKRFECYAKRVRVTAPGAGECDLLFVWKRLSDGSLDLCVLISTLEGLGVQTLLAAWKARWALEVAHRLYKQNFGLGTCQARAFSFQLCHASLVLQAFFLVRLERVRCSGLSWRVAQARVAGSLRLAVLTEVKPLQA
jgi:DDE superfamily endonuclease